MKKRIFAIGMILLALLASLTGCSKKQEDAHGPTWNGEYSIVLPDGYTSSQDNSGNLIFSHEGQPIGGMKIYTAPEEFSVSEYFTRDFLISLGIEEATDVSLGYFEGGSPSGAGSAGWNIEYFSDVPNPEDRSVHMVHQFFVMSDGVTILDFWIDLMHTDYITKDQILNSIEIPEIERYHQIPSAEVPTLPPVIEYELLDLPEGYGCDVLGEKCILFIRDGIVVGGLDVLAIPDGIYDPEDSHWLWLERSGLSAFQNEDFQYMGGMTAPGNGWIAEFCNDVPEGQPGYIHSRHIYHVSDNQLYDIWLDMVLLTYEEADSLSRAVQFPFN